MLVSGTEMFWMPQRDVLVTTFYDTAGLRSTYHYHMKPRHCAPCSCLALHKL